MRSSTVLFALVVVAACALQLAAASRPVQRIVISEGVGASPAVHRHQRNSTADFFSSPDAACHFGSLPGSCISAKESCGGSSIPDGACGSGGVCCVPQATPKAGCGSAAITRAMTWVHVNLTYCQSPRGKPDYDKACKPVCERISNPEWNAYRSDCSAFVSWAYGESNALACGRGVHSARGTDAARVEGARSGCRDTVLTGSAPWPLCLCVVFSLSPISLRLWFCLCLPLRSFNLFSSPP